jgi:hypothetical protein
LESPDLSQEARGKQAMRKAIADEADVLIAMERVDLGAIDFRYGRAGDPTRAFQGGFGVAHIVAKHGAVTALEVPGVIADGEAAHGKTRVFLDRNGWRVILATNFNGTPANAWPVTGYQIEKDNR